MNNKKHTRRQFIKKAAGAGAGLLAVPYIIPSNILGRSGVISPGNKITVGCIGTGWQGTSNLEGFLNEDDVQVVAVCDIDKNHLHEARDLVNDKYGNNGCSVYHDFRELLNRDDIDAVSIATPDHWHAIPTIAAAKAGKDIYSEKPLSHSLMEGESYL